ncbi:MAG: ATP-dependent Clp protease ATP-binding subunit, partial [Elusimicrobia bacterium]|nr:ATP-dependent Clp protease ATP-binding subunit [Elusimicrobiota bacterium]
VNLAVRDPGRRGAGRWATTPQPPTPKPETPKVKTFPEILNDPALKLSDKEKGFLQIMLKEMKFEKKPPVIGRVDETNRVLTSITSPRGVINSVVLIGEAGVGKTAIAEKLAQAISLSETQLEGETFQLKKMQGRYLLKFNLDKLLIQDDPAKALEAMLQLLSRFSDPDPRKGSKIILFVDEIHKIFQHSKGDQMANLLKEPLRDGELTLITATTRAEYKKFMESDDAFRRRLIPIWINEATVPETMRMLQGAKGFYEQLYELTITPEALKATAELSKYDQEVFNPGRAFKYLVLAANNANFDTQRDRLSLTIQDKMVDLQYAMNRLTAEMRKKDLVTEGIKNEEPSTIELYNWALHLTQQIIELYQKRTQVPTSGTPVVTDEMVKGEISINTGIASGQLTLGQESMEKYQNMEEILGKRVIGQEEAIHTTAEAVRANKAGLSQPNTPIGVFYLTGPTGSGKTHFAKELARFLFEDPESAIRIDMSEYQHDHEVSKMIGSPPGYVGYEQAGQLTEKVRRRPNSVILFDEIEKAHPAVWDIMLQIMSEGRLTDGHGRTVDFKNTIILMTSNLGMHAINPTLAPFEAKYAQIKSQLADLDTEEKNLEPNQKTQENLREINQKREELKGLKKTLLIQLAEEVKAKTKQVTEQAFKDTYRPEFRGRLHAEPIIFNSITPEMAVKIVELNLRELSQILERAGHEMAWTNEVVDYLVEEGFSITLGARPLNNAIQRLVTTPIANEILASASRNGNKVLSSHIQLDIQEGKIQSGERSRIQIEVQPLKPKKIEKRKPGEGADQRLFGFVFETVLRAAANQMVPDVSAQTLDHWVKEALTGKKQNDQIENTEPESTDSFFNLNKKMDLPNNASITNTTHYRIEGKDPGVKNAREAIESALKQAGYSESVRDALLRNAPDNQNSHVGWLKLFVEQAKKMSPEENQKTPVQILYKIDQDSIRIVLHRNTEITPQEINVLTNHFTGQAPATREEARNKAEMMNVLGEDGRRLFFELYRVLSTIPGTRMGYAAGEKAQGGQGTDYWIEIPKRVESSELGVESSENSTETTPEVNSQEVSPENQKLQIEAASAKPDLGKHKSTVTANNNLLGDNDHKYASAASKIRKAIDANGYSEITRETINLFLLKTTDFLKETSYRLEPVSLDWQINPDSILVLVRRSGRGFDNKDISKLKALIRKNPKLRNGLKNIQARVLHGSEDTSYNGGASVWLEISNPQTTPTETISNSDTTSPAVTAPPATTAPSPENVRQAVLNSETGFRHQLLRFLFTLLDQGDQRGPTLRMTAAETLAALSTPAYLSLARDWIRFENMDSHYPEVMAAALILGRHGNRAEDEPRLIRAMAYLSHRGDHLFNPAKARVGEAFAELLGKDGSPQTEELSQRFIHELQKPSGILSSEAQIDLLLNNVLLDALYLALCRYGDIHAKEQLNQYGQTPDRTPALYRYLTRIDPSYLQELYRTWHQDGTWPEDLRMKRLLLYAIADYGTGGTDHSPGDLEKLTEAVRRNNFGAYSTDIPLLTQALARMVKRLRVYDQIKEEIQNSWLRPPLAEHSTSSLARAMAGIQIAGEAG